MNDAKNSNIENKLNCHPINSKIKSKTLIIIKTKLPETLLFKMSSEPMFLELTTNIKNITNNKIEMNPPLLASLTLVNI